MQSNFKLSIDDDKSVREDLNARSISFFSKSKLTCVTEGLLEELKNTALSKKKNTRILLHEDPQNQVHEMVIFQHFGKFFPPKKHQNKMKSFKIHKGKLAIFVFNDDGSILDQVNLGESGNLMYRVEPGYYHMDIPTTPHTINFETTTGPFLGDLDNIIPPWFSKLEDDEEKMNFHDNLIKSYIQNQQL